MIYLDHNATTPVAPEVVDAMVPYLRDHWGNPSSDHPWGVRARQGVDDARAQVAALLGCAAHEVVFTSGGTEANNLAIHGVAAAAPRGRHLVISAVEHPATTAPAAVLEQQGWTVTRLGVDPDGRASTALPDDEGLTLLSVMLANNETGVLQPVAELARAAHAVGAVAHTDAAQAVGKIDVDVDVLGVDLLSVAGHKLYAPKGVGALYVRQGTPIQPVARGAGHEGGLRPGTENVASIVGLGVACRLARQTLAAQRQRQAALRDRLVAGLAAAIPGSRRVGDGAPTLPNTACVLFPDVTGHAVLGATDALAASTGSACHAGEVTPSAVLLAMGLAPDVARGAVRLSLGRATTEDDVEQAIEALVGAWHRAG